MVKKWPQYQSVGQQAAEQHSILNALKKTQQSPGQRLFKQPGLDVVGHIKESFKKK